MQIIIIFLNHIVCEGVNSKEQSLTVCFVIKMPEFKLWLYGTVCLRPLASHLKSMSLGTSVKWGAQYYFQHRVSEGINDEKIVYSKHKIFNKFQLQNNYWIFNNNKKTHVIKLSFLSNIYRLFHYYESIVIFLRVYVSPRYYHLEWSLEKCYHLQSQLNKMNSAFLKILML